MARNSLFGALDLSHKPKRNGFDKSFNHKFTAQIGQLLCPMHMVAMPSGKYRIQTVHDTQTPPVNTASYVQFTEYFDFFAVPLRVLFKDAGNILVDNQQNPTLATSPYANKRVGVDLPQISMQDIWRYRVTSEAGHGQPGYITRLSSELNAFGFNRGALAVKHLGMLGYGYVSFADWESFYLSDSGGTADDKNPTPFVGQDRVALFPLLAYQKIYYDFYRNSQWEDNQPYNYNVDYLGENPFVQLNTSDRNVYGDYWDNPTMFDIRYSNYPKDLFFGVLPESQFGDTATVEATSSNVDDAGILVKSSPLRYYSSLDSENPLGGENGEVANATTTGASLSDTTAYLSSDNSTFFGNLYNSSYLKVDNTEALKGLLGSLSAKFDILELRKAKAVQKYREILGTGDFGYRDRIRKIFGIKVPDYMGEQCIYLGGTSNNVSVRPIVNQNLTGSNDAVRRGTVEANGATGSIEFEAKEDCILMCIYHVNPKIDYNLNAFHFDVTKITADDYANPVFDQLGFQELPLQYLNIARDTSPLADDVTTKFLGYTTRYFDYKTSVDMTSGAFKDSLKTEGWIAPLDMDYLRSFRVSNGSSYDFRLNMNFFKVNPNLIDGVFSVDASDSPNTDQFRVNATFNIHAVLPLDYLGVPNNY